MKNQKYIFRKTIILLAFYFLQAALCDAQNLVPNPSFEQYSICPYATDQVNYSIGWTKYSCSPDYFNSCATTQTVNVPYNFAGYQPAASGNAYCGLATYVSPTIVFNNYREYLGSVLISNLIVGVKYFISIKANLGINYINHCNCASDNLGIKFFTKVPFIPTNYPPIYNNAQFYSNTIITDTLNWISLFGSFISDSAYEYFIIGNLFDDNHTDTLIMDSDSLCRGAYYYIDDICVSTDSGYCAGYIYTEINDKNELSFLKIYPNPASNYLNIDFPFFVSAYEIEIFDVFGRNMLKQKIYENQVMLNISNIPKGLLSIKISFNNQYLYYKLLKQ
jgi:hypothetical protein